MLVSFDTSPIKRPIPSVGHKICQLRRVESEHGCMSVTGLSENTAVCQLHRISQSAAVCQFRRVVSQNTAAY